STTRPESLRPSFRMMPSPSAVETDSARMDRVRKVRRMKALCSRYLYAPRLAPGAAFPAPTNYLFRRRRTFFWSKNRQFDFFDLSDAIRQIDLVDLSEKCRQIDFFELSASGRWPRAGRTRVPT